MLKIFFIITILLITYIIKYNKTIENMDNINDYNFLIYSKKYKNTLKKKYIFFRKFLN